MTRGLSSNVITELESGSTTVEHLLALEYWDPGAETEDISYITTAPFDITYNSNTFSAVGLPSGDTALGIAPIQETSDMRAQGVEITLDAVDQSFVSTILQRDFRGRSIRIWKRFYSDDGGSVIDTFLVWKGLQNDAYEVSHSNPTDNDEVATSTITTNSVSELARLDKTKAVKTNVESHRDMLDRNNQAVTDTGFTTVSAIADKKIFWGREVPEEFESSRDTEGPQYDWSDE